MTRKNGHIEFGEFCLEPSTQELLRDGAEVHLAKRPFQVLSFLIENRDRLVERRELLDKFWDGHDVYDDALRKCVGAIRTALGDTARPARFIETRYGSGYRFVGEIRVEPGRVDREAMPAGLFQQRRVFLTVLGIVLAAFVGMGLYLVVSSDRSGMAADILGPRRVNSVAVMPLKNLTGDAANDYFCEGMTESLVSDLSRIDGLRTVASGSTAAVAKRTDDPREIGRLLAVEAIIQGSVQKRGETLSVAIHLVGTDDGAIIWTAPDVERRPDEAADIQTTLARAVAVALQGEMHGDKRTSPGSAAYQAYLKGRFHWNKRTADGIRRSIEHYEEAIALEPDYALAYAGLAESYVQGIWHVPFESKEALAKARAAGERALAIDPQLPEAYTALAGVDSLEWRWAEADQRLLRATQLNPRFARAYHARAFVLLIRGRRDEAIDCIEVARSLDPLNLVINTDKAMIFFAAHRDDEAFRQWQTTLELDPNFALAHEHLAMAYGVVGNEQAAIAEMLQGMELKGTPRDEIARFRSIASRGLRAVRERELNDLLAAERRGDKVSSVYIASRYLALGKREESIRRLGSALDQHSAEIVIARTSREFDALQDDPRLGDIFRRAGMID